MKMKYIKDKLTLLRTQVAIDNEILHFDINKIVEDVYMHILNDVYGWELKNANLLKENFPAIDLIDDTNKIVIQVTSTTDTTKLKKTIQKFKALNGYDNYRLKMFYINDKPNFNSSSLKEFSKDGISKTDLLGIKDILEKVQSDVDICDKLYATLQKIFKNTQKDKISITIHGDVKGVVHAESGSVINQTIS